MRRFFQNTFRGFRYFWYFYSSWEILVSLSKITAELKYLQETERFLVTRIKDQRAATAALRRSLKFVNSLFVCLFVFVFLYCLQHRRKNNLWVDWEGERCWAKAAALAEGLCRSQSGWITPSPGRFGDTVPPSQSPNKDGHDNFPARALLGSYSGSHSKCSIISGRVLKKPHVKICDFETTGGDLLERGIVHATCA